MPPHELSLPSLLDGRASGGVVGETPHVQEVLAAARHVG